jgi:hypothetical protein
MDSVAVVEVDHGQAVILDLNMSLENVTASRRFCFTTFRVILRPYQRPGNAYANLQILPLATCLPRVDSR